MSLHQQAGKPATADMLINIPQLISAYYTYHPDINDPQQRISFGTSGHRGSALKKTFNEDHILAVSQAICDIRKSNHFDGPLFIGKDTHALSEPAFLTAIEVFAGNNVRIMIDKDLGYTPTPVISHAVICYNRDHQEQRADGVVITPSHNPPEDGGFKYNPSSGGPADKDLTGKIEVRANEILADQLNSVRRKIVEKALKQETTVYHDYINPYVRDLDSVVDLDAIRREDLTIGVDPMGGSGIAYWEPIADKYKLKIELVNKHIDPTFSFMTVDKDGKIRMDCSSPYAMAGLIGLKDKYDIAFGNDPDYDRHGIVTKSSGLLNPNHYLAVAIRYLFQHRSKWKEELAIGKTLVSSAMIDRIAKSLGRELYEVPVGFKWFVDGLLEGRLGFGGEESAGAAFLRQNGRTWTTDKDGIIMDLLAAEITAKTSKDPAEHYRQIEDQFGSATYERIDAPANKSEKEKLKRLDEKSIKTNELAGEKIIDKLTKSPGNQASIGGLKIITENGWFAARPSGTEDIYKIYAESFKGATHLKQIQQEAQQLINNVLK